MNNKNIMKTVFWMFLFLSGEIAMGYDMGKLLSTNLKERKMEYEIIVSTINSKNLDKRKQMISELVGILRKKEC